MQTGVMQVFWFAAVIAAIPLTLWLLKRTPLGAGMAGGRADGAPRVVAVLPLAQQQRLVTVEVGHGEDRLWLVLGVGAHGIRTLHTMSPQNDGADGGALSAAPPPAAAFAQLLGRLRGSGDKEGGDAR